jgi:hypothetical protein
VTIEFGDTSKVQPSCGAASKASIAIAPPTPGRLSTMAVNPAVRRKASTKARATVSVVPPAGAGTIRRSRGGRFDCAAMFDAAQPASNAKR